MIAAELTQTATAEEKAEIIEIVATAERETTTKATRERDTTEIETDTTTAGATAETTAEDPLAHLSVTEGLEAKDSITTTTATTTTATTPTATTMTSTTEALTSLSEAAVYRACVRALLHSSTRLWHDELRRTVDINNSPTTTNTTTTTEKKPITVEIMMSPFDDAISTIYYGTSLASLASYLL
jgi:hypothetical protein